MVGVFYVIRIFWNFLNRKTAIRDAKIGLHPLTRRRQTHKITVIKSRLTVVRGLVQVAFIDVNVFGIDAVMINVLPNNLRNVIGNH